MKAKAGADESGKVNRTLKVTILTAADVDAKLAEIQQKYQMSEDDIFDYHAYLDHWRAVQEAASAETGVEMGKVNRVDEKLKNLLRRCYQWIPLEVSDLADDVKEALGMETYRAIRGSAETGGEKAAWVELAKRERFAFTDNLEREIALRGGCGFDFDQLQNVRAIALTAYARAVAPPNFRRTSQNQTVSSGVQGAHEGTTADEKADSREPEKLNNAQNGVAMKTQAMIDHATHWTPQQLWEICQCGEIRGHHAFGSGFLCSDPDKCKKFALAESSLSHDANCVCISCMSKATGELLKHDVSLDPGRCCDNGYFGQPHTCQKSNPESSLSSPPPKSDLSVPTTPAPSSTQLDTTTEKI